jgi:spore germination protein YaaH
MGKTLLIFISFCAIILFNTWVNATTNSRYANKININHNAADTTKKPDAAKAAADKAAALAKIAAERKATAATKTAAAAKKAADDAKAAALKKSKITAIVDKLIKPFKFKANERQRIENLIHIYIVNDSIAAAPSVVNLNTQLNDVRALIYAINAQYTADSLSNSKHLQAFSRYQLLTDSLKTVIKNLKQPNPVIKKDTPKVTAAAPIKGKDAALPVSDAMQQKLNLTRDILKAPLMDAIPTKNKDSIITRKITIKLKKEVLGFYSDATPYTSHFDTINYKLMTTLVYAVNADKIPTGLGKNAWIVDSAKKRNLNVILSFYTTSADKTQALLTDKNRDSLIAQSVQLLHQNKISGINIDFEGLERVPKNKFEEFIHQFYMVYQQPKNQFSICITVPGTDKFTGYNLPALDQYTKYFIIDFTKRPSGPGPMSTLANSGTYSIKSCFNSYLNKGILANKFILCLPYYGRRWNKTSKAYIDSVSYSDIQNQYADSAAVYNDDESAVKKEGIYNKAPITVWYDNDKTLSGKYDFALNNALAGIAIKYVGDDNNTGDLKNELIYKFATIDTIKLATVRDTMKASLNDFIFHLLNSPCNGYINPVYSKILLIANISIVAVMVVLGLVLFYQVKINGDNWKPKKTLIRVLTGLFMLWSFLFLMWLFFWNDNPFFGPNAKENCIDISFVTLFIILLIGTIVGIGSYWFYHLSQPDEKP